MSLPRRQDPRFIARSATMRALEAEADHAARSDAKVLITGETGTGKEVVARLIHQRSPRASSNMVTLNCAGLPDSLLESELFGHVKGSFTGAYRDKPGLLETAPNGTVFLDEVGEMTPRMQVVLLRFLETGEIQRIGAERSHTRVNVRLITATNRNLEAEVLAGAFREDLFFRLNVVRLHIPPLRDRIDDIVPLVDYYLHWYGQAHRTSPPAISPEAQELLRTYRWPGNVRELRNVVERIVLKTDGAVLRPADLPIEITRSIERREPADVRGRDDAAQASRADELAAMMLKHGQSFWSAVYPVFMSRDITRADLRRIIQLGLEETRGNYRVLVESFNMPAGDYKRFLSFLRKHDCHLPFQQFRAAGHTDERPALRAVAGGKP
ncbi:sigma-54 interaction domain-containing protein [Mycolicibacterium sp.]|uniref:sigma-54 interaction domain-containing protein n=1 Tax=Mycolicibacterium sp. TaxID=2320850 RepID=UPI0037C6343F